MITLKQIKAARSLLDWTQSDLAIRAKVSLATVQRIEKNGLDNVQYSNVDNIKTTLESAGIVFLGLEGVTTSGDRAKTEREGT